MPSVCPGDTAGGRDFGAASENSCRERRKEANPSPKWNRSQVRGARVSDAPITILSTRGSEASFGLVFVHSRPSTVE